MGPKSTPLSSRSRPDSAPSTSPAVKPRCPSSLMAIIEPQASPTAVSSAAQPGPSPHTSKATDTKTSESFLHCAEVAAPPSSRQGGATLEARPGASSPAAAAPASAQSPCPSRVPCRASNNSSNSDGNNEINAHRGLAGLSQSCTMQYQQNWSQVVLGATSGIMFVLVVCLSYALYVLVTPYYYSITSGVLLSIVMHPQSRLRSVLYMGTAVERMRRVQQQWSERGRLAGVVGSWLSLRHFASFVVMQVAFFLGLHKIRVAANSFLAGEAVNRSERAVPRRGETAHGTTSAAPSAAPSKTSMKEMESAGESRTSSPRLHAAGRTAAHAAQWRATAESLRASHGEAGQSSSTHLDGEKGSNEESAEASSSSTGHSQAFHCRMDSPLLTPFPNSSIVWSPASALPLSAGTSAAAGAAVPRHRRLVATAHGRRVLRCLTLATLVILAHFLLGIFYFLLLHLALGVVFALVVPLLSPQTFVTSMGRLWRIALALFFVVGLTMNLTADVLSISDVVRRTTSAVVRSGSRGGGGDVNAVEICSSGSGPASCEAAPAATFDHWEGDLLAETGGAATEEPVVDSVKEMEGTATTQTDSIDAFALLRQHRGKLEALVVHQVQTLVVQELAGMFSHGNVSEMLNTLMRVLPPPLYAVVRPDTADGSEGERPMSLSSATGRGSSDSSARASSNDASVAAAAKASRSPASLWANVRAVGSINALKSLVYESLSSTSAANSSGGGWSKGTARASSSPSDSASNGSGGAAASVAARKEAEEMHIDWITVFRLLASRLLPYVEHGLRLLIRLASNLLGLFDSIYALMLFVFFYRYLTQLEHTVLYYGIAKLLCVMQPEVGDLHARNIEHDITVSFITLLQSFWHLTWFHFSVTFCAFQMWGFPTPFLLGLVSVVLALFPLVPKWLSPCSIAFVYMVVQLISLTTAEKREGSPFLVFSNGRAWTEALILGKPYFRCYARMLSFGLAMVLECGDEWLLCVSRGLRVSFTTDAAGKGQEQLQPFVIGTALVLGFVAYGIRGIVFGPLTVIVARVLFDNWDIVLTNREMGVPSPALPLSPAAEEEKEEDREREAATATR